MACRLPLGDGAVGQDPEPIRHPEGYGPAPSKNQVSGGMTRFSVQRSLHLQGSRATPDC